MPLLAVITRQKHLILLLQLSYKKNVVNPASTSVSIMLEWCRFFFFCLSIHKHISGKFLLPWQKVYRLLRNISNEYTTKEATENLASDLLDGKQPGGGVGFITNQCVNGRSVVWHKVALKVLEHWVEVASHTRKCFGSVLYAALEKTMPDPTEPVKFRRQLNDRPLW